MHRTTQWDKIGCHKMDAYFANEATKTQRVGVTCPKHRVV